MNQPVEERPPEPETIDAREKRVSSGPGLRELQGQLLEGLLRATAIVGFVVVAAGSFASLSSGDIWTIPFYAGAYVLILLVLFWRKAPYGLRAGALIGLAYVMGVIDFVQDGPSGSARVFILIVPFLTAILLGFRESVFALLVSSLTMAAAGVAFYTGLLVLPDDPNATDLASWIAGSLVVFLLGTLMVVSLNYLGPRLTTALGQSRRLARELEQERSHLEELVADRTAALAQRSTQLEAAAQIARDATAIQDVERLLEETVRLISARFGFYHTGIFLLDEAGQYAVLRAVSSPGGQRMLERGHRLEVGDTSIVGYVTRHGQPRIAMDVGQDAVVFDNPDLPSTRSEIALPLEVRGEIIGALDVQRRVPGAFGDEDIVVLQTLADQVAVAISNARLFRQAQAGLEAERRAYGELSRQAWAELVRRRDELVYRGQEGVVSVSGEQDEMPVADDLPTIDIPVRVRGQVVAVIQARKPDVTSEWTFDESQVINALAEQLGQALESARLYQDTQRRAARERLIGQVTGRMRETLDVERVLQTAAQEMLDALGLVRAEVWIGTDQDGAEAVPEAIKDVGDAS